MSIYGYTAVCIDPKTKLLGGGIVLICLNPNNQGIKREFGHPFSSCELNSARLKNITMLLNSILPKYRNLALKIYIDNDDIESQIEGGDDDALETKKWLSYYKTASLIKVDHLSGHYQRAKELALVSAGTQKSYDSGSQNYRE